MYEVQQDGWIQTAPTTGYHGPLLINSVTPVYVDQDFGNIAADPQISLTKSVVPDNELWDYHDNGNGVFDAGDSVVYSFVVENTGNVDLTGVVIEEVDFDLLGDLPTTIVVGDLAAGEVSTTYEVTYVVTQDDIDYLYVHNDGQVYNNARATGSYGETGVSDEDDAVS